MRTTKFWQKLVLCMVLIAAMALLAVGCSETGETPEAPASEGAVDSDATPIGEGATSFDLTVTKADGSKTLYAVSTDETTVGAALLALELIAGDEGEFGLYVKTVDGETHVYEDDGMYWAFYINDEYATTGVDMTDIEAGAAYELRAE